jgi:hypothetical protein
MRKKWADFLGGNAMKMDSLFRPVHLEICTFSSPNVCVLFISGFR